MRRQLRSLWSQLALVLILGSSSAWAADHAFTATVISVDPGAASSRFEDFFEVGQPLLGSVTYIETLTPIGFLDGTMQTSVFEHPSPDFAPGVYVRLGKLARILRDPTDPVRIERSLSGTDFVMRTNPQFDHFDTYGGATPDAPIFIEVRLEGLAAVDYRSLPDPLELGPTGTGLLVISADESFDDACAAPADCVAVAEIETLRADVDSDVDGVLDSIDNCRNEPNGRLAPVALICRDQRDADRDGYGNACDGDHNNDGATGLDDLAEVWAQVFTPIEGLGPLMKYDRDCFATWVDYEDAFRVFRDAIDVKTPGPSGLPCAGLVPCP